MDHEDVEVLDVEQLEVPVDRLLDPLCVVGGGAMGRSDFGV